MSSCFPCTEEMVLFQCLSCRKNDFTFPQDNLRLSFLRLGGENRVFPVSNSVKTRSCVSVKFPSCSKSRNVKLVCLLLNLVFCLDLWIFFPIWFSFRKSLVVQVVWRVTVVEIWVSSGSWDVTTVGSLRASAVHPPWRSWRDDCICFGL